MDSLIHYLDVYTYRVQVYINVNKSLQKRMHVYKVVNMLIYKDVYGFVLFVNKMRIQVNEVYRNVYIFYTFITIRKND